MGGWSPREVWEGKSLEAVLGDSNHREILSDKIQGEVWQDKSPGEHCQEWEGKTRELDLLVIGKNAQEVKLSSFSFQTMFSAS